MNRDRMLEDWNAWSAHARRVDPRAIDGRDIWELGVADAEMILSDVEALIPRDATALELGCGWGRLMRPMAGRFKEVWGVDISPAMLERATASLAGLPNVQLRLNNGVDLSVVPEAAFDFCYSMFLFDCLPTRELVRDYLREAHRVLKDGGILKIQVAGVYAANPFRHVYEDADTWQGIRFTLGEIATMFEAAGFEVHRAYHAHTPQQLVAEPGKHPSEEEQYRLWVVARKGPHMDRAEAMYAALARKLVELLPAGATVLSPETGMAAYLMAVGGDALHLQPLYNPSNGQEAVASVHRHRADGARLLFFTPATAWWLEFYPELTEWLTAEARLVYSEQNVRIFDLSA